MDFYTGTQPDELRKSPKGIIAGTLAVLLLLGAAGFTARVVKDFTPIESEFSAAESTVVPLISEPEPTSEPDDIYITETIQNTLLRRGSMILVNNAYGYEEFEEDLVSVYENKNEFYYVSSIDLLMRKDAVEAMNEMMAAFHDETGLKNVQIVSGYRTKEHQQELYKADEGEEGSKTVAKPGHSEHQTGLACDFNLFFGDYSDDFDGTGDYTWFAENCAEFGFILRYPEDKIETTEIAYEPWHFRYVGEPHASEMTSRGLCLEEYIELLSAYTYDGEHLEITGLDGQKYEIYTFPADILSDTTTVPVPADQGYTIHGNNIDRYIVTVAIGTSPTTTTLPAETTTESTETTTTEPEETTTDEETENEE